MVTLHALTRGASDRDAGQRPLQVVQIIDDLISVIMTVERDLMGLGRAMVFRRSSVWILVLQGFCQRQHHFLVRSAYTPKGPPRASAAAARIMGCRSVLSMASQIIHAE